MPYVRCSKCGQLAFSAARWSHIDHCGRCGAELPRVRSVAEPSQYRPRIPEAPPDKKAPRWQAASDNRRNGSTDVQR